MFEWSNLVYGLSTYCTFVLGTLCNTISLSYFLQQSRNTSPSTFIFIVNNTADLLVSLAPDRGSPERGLA